MWKEAAWTAGTIKKQMPGIDAGRDLYIAGIRRGLVKKSFSQSGLIAAGTVLMSVEGSGCITKISATSVRDSWNNITISSNIAVILDDTQEVYVSNSGQSTSSLSFEYSNNISNPIDIFEQAISISNQNVVINCPIFFERKMEVVCKDGMWTDGHAAATCGIEYILDPTGSGGVMRKFTYKKIAHTALLKGRRCAA